MYAYPASLGGATAEAARVDVDLRREGVDFPALRDRIFGRIDAISEGGLRYRRDELEHGRARDARQDRAVQRRRRDVERAVVALEHHEEVHRARLGDLVAEQPEALVVAELRGVLLRLERRRVVERELVPARAAGP